MQSEVQVAPDTPPRPLHCSPWLKKTVSFTQRNTCPDDSHQLTPMGIVDNTIKTTRANTVNNSNAYTFIEFHSPTAALIILACLVVLFLCCKLLWTCKHYFKKCHGSSAPAATTTGQPRGSPTLTFDNGTEIHCPPLHSALRFDRAAATNHAGFGHTLSTDQLWTYQKALPQAHSRWNEI